MLKVTPKEAKANFSSLLAAVEGQDVTVLICRKGIPVADLVPHRPFKRNVKPHPRLSKIKINYDPTEPLTPDELGFGKM